MNPIDELARSAGEVADFFGGLTDEEWTLRVGDAWTPTEHLTHLCILRNALARGFALNRWLLRLRFGTLRRPSRDYDAVRAAYLERIAAGGKSPGDFVPRRTDVAPAEVPAHRAGQLVRWGRVHGRLVDAASRWIDRDLDRIRLPHPLLGDLTAREMLLFAAYHDRHHIAAASRRLPRFADTVRP